MTGPPTAERRPGQGSGSSASGLAKHQQRTASGPSSASRRATRLSSVERSCDLAWLHLAAAGLVSSRPDDLVTATLRLVLAEAYREAA